MARLKPSVTVTALWLLGKPDSLACQADSENLVQHPGAKSLLCPLDTRTCHITAANLPKEDQLKPSSLQTAGRRNLCQLFESRQIHLERDDGHGDLPTFEHLWMNFADQTDRRFGDDDPSDATVEKRRMRDRF